MTTAFRGSAPDLLRIPGGAHDQRPYCISGTILICYGKFEFGAAEIQEVIRSRCPDNFSSAFSALSAVKIKSEGEEE
jgi:hypothetical protein